MSASEADNRRRLADCVRLLQEAESAIDDERSGSADEWLQTIQAKLEELAADMNEDKFEEIDVHEVSAAEANVQSHVKAEVKSEDDEEPKPEIEA